MANLDRMQGLFSHVDLRVRDGKCALAFYDTLMGQLGLYRVRETPFSGLEPVWRSVGCKANDEFFGFVVDSVSSANLKRIASRAGSRPQVDRVNRYRRAGAREVDGPKDYGNGASYATFFEDSDGNRLEVCFLTSTAA